MTTPPQPEPKHEDPGNLEVRIIHMTHRIGKINHIQKYLGFPNTNLYVDGYNKSEQIGLLNMALERYHRDLERYQKGIIRGD